MDRKLRVLFINDSPILHGDTQMLFKIIQTIDRSRFEVLVASPGYGPVNQLFCDVPAIRRYHIDLGADTPPERRWPGRFEAVRTAFQYLALCLLPIISGADIIVGVDRRRSAVGSLFAGLASRRKRVFYTQFLFYPAVGPLKAIAARTADCLIAPSAAVCETFAAIGCDPARMLVAWNGVPVDQFASGNGAGVRAQLGIPADAPVVVLAGRLSPYKGQLEVIDAAAIVCRQFPDVRFLFAGVDCGEGVLVYGNDAPPYVDMLRERIAEHVLQERVLLLGRRADMPDVFAAADVSLSASWQEPCAQVILESMAAGKPQVVTNAGGNPELVSDGEAGWLVPVRDPAAMAAAINDLLAHPDRAAQMGRVAATRARALFTTERHVQLFEASLEALAKPAANSLAT